MTCEAVLTRPACCGWGPQGKLDSRPRPVAPWNLKQLLNRGRGRGKSNCNWKITQLTSGALQSRLCACGDGAGARAGSPRGQDAECVPQPFTIKSNPVPGGHTRPAWEVPVTVQAGDPKSVECAPLCCSLPFNVGLLLHREVSVQREVMGPRYR